jgi:dTDP-4-dehydrorhamnose reductase
MAIVKMIQKKPLNVYGESKLAGENLIIQNMDKYYIIRTAWLFGKYGKNFVDTMLGLADQKKELSVVGDQFGSPTYAKDLASFVVSNFLENSKLPFGVYHITNSGVCSWYELAEETFKVAKKNVVLNKVDSSAFPRPAKRPHYSILLNKKLKNCPRDWKEALGAYLALANPSL